MGPIRDPIPEWVWVCDESYTHGMGMGMGESASIPFVGFGDLDNNTLKGLINLLSVEQES
jgi:hypothetical protein